MDKNKHEYNRLLDKQHGYMRKIANGEKLSVDDVVSIERIKTLQEDLLEKIGSYTPNDIIHGFRE